MSAQWWIRRDNNTVGPVSVEELKRMAGDGQLNSNSEIRLGKTTQWVEAQSLHWLREHFQSLSDQANAPPVKVATVRKTLLSPLASFAVGTCVAVLVGLIALFLIHGFDVPPSQNEPKLTNIKQQQPVPSQINHRHDLEEVAANSNKADDNFRTNGEVASPRIDSGKVFPRSSTRKRQDKAIQNIKDDASMKHAVGLVVCGWTGIDEKMSPFVHRIQPLIYTPTEFASLSEVAKARFTKVRLHGNRQFYFELLLGDTGSGFLISPDGYLLTNVHVVDEVNELSHDRKKLRGMQQRMNYRNLKPKIWVFLNDMAHEAEIVHISDPFDLAILKIRVHNSPYFQLSNSKQIDRASDVWALGFPGASRRAISDEEEEFTENCWSRAKSIDFFFKSSDLEYGITKGIVSVVTERAGVGRVIQHNADISAGNSGGPLLDDQAVVVGINTFSITQATGGKASGIFYALNMHQLRKEIDPHVPGCDWK